MVKIIALFGKSASGKDTLQKYLVDELKCGRRVSESHNQAAA